MLRGVTNSCHPLPFQDKYFLFALTYLLIFEPLRG